MRADGTCLVGSPLDARLLTGCSARKGRDGGRTEPWVSLVATPIVLLFHVILRHEAEVGTYYQGREVGINHPFPLYSAGV
jgi:hypothetical protein